MIKLGVARVRRCTVDINRLSLATPPPAFLPLGTRATRTARARATTRGQKEIEHILTTPLHVSKVEDRCCKKFLDDEKRDLEGKIKARIQEEIAELKVSVMEVLAGKATEVSVSKKLEVALRREMEKLAARMEKMAGDSLVQGAKTEEHLGKQKMLTMLLRNELAEKMVQSMESNPDIEKNKRETEKMKKKISKYKKGFAEKQVEISKMWKTIHERKMKIDSIKENASRKQTDDEVMIQLLQHKVKQMSSTQTQLKKSIEGQRKEIDSKRREMVDLKEDFTKMLYEIKGTREVTEQTMINKIKSLEEELIVAQRTQGSFGNDMGKGQQKEKRKCKEKDQSEHIKRLRLQENFHTEHFEELPVDWNNSCKASTEEHFGGKGMVSETEDEDLSYVHVQGNMSQDVGSDAVNDKTHFEEAGQGVENNDFQELSREQLLFDAVSEIFILGT